MCFQAGNNNDEDIVSTKPKTAASTKPMAKPTAPRKKITKPKASATKATAASAPTKAAAATKAPAAKTATPTVVDAPKAVILGPVMRKKELVDTVVTRSGLKKKDVKPVVEQMLAVMGEAIGDNRELNLPPVWAPDGTQGKEAQEWQDGHYKNSANRAAIGRPANAHAPAQEIA